MADLTDLILFNDYDPVEVAPPCLSTQIGAVGMRRAVIDGHFT